MRHIDHHDGVAVRRRPRQQRRSDHAARARPVVHDHLLSEDFAKLRRQQSRTDIGGAARGIGDQQPNGSARVRLCERDIGREREHRDCEGDPERAVRVIPLLNGP